jgi:hypothetical protein
VFLNKVGEKKNSREVFESNFDYFLHVAHRKLRKY